MIAYSEDIPWHDVQNQYVCTWYILCLFLLWMSPMQCDSQFKSSFGNVKAFDLNKIKMIAEPVATMAGGCPEAGGLQWQANSLGRAYYSA